MQLLYDEVVDFCRRLQVEDVDETEESILERRRLTINHPSNPVAESLKRQAKVRLMTTSEDLMMASLSLMERELIKPVMAV